MLRLKEKVMRMSGYSNSYIGLEGITVSIKFVLTNNKDYIKIFVLKNTTKYFYLHFLKRDIIVPFSKI
jgi:hypothetical protein